MRLKDKIALVSGAARGMGSGIAELFAREGASRRYRHAGPPSFRWDGERATRHQPQGDVARSQRAEK
jgi:NAD(P)-dependent dehydrogenase (short-subunit alcohol dehydrogenase family)